MGLNYLALIVAGLVPMVLGFVWYGPLFGKAWMSSLGITEEDTKKGNMGLIFGLATLMSLILAFGIFSSIAASHGEFDGHGQSHQTFKHGAFHGAFFALLIGIPILVSNSLFQRNSLKNIGINVAYWILTCALMGGIVDAWR